MSVTVTDSTIKGTETITKTMAQVVKESNNFRKPLIDKYKLRSILPEMNETLFDDLYDALTKLLPVYGVTTPRRIRYFLAQTMFETRNFTKLIETLHYTTPQRIAQVWPKRFTVGNHPTLKDARLYVRNPQKLANAVYANRYGNGSEESGDGFKYRGRGATHLTFKDNYKQCSIALFNDLRLVEDPDLVSEDMHICIETALWFWSTKNLNQLADQDNFTEVTKRINGSTTTTKDRLPTLKLTAKLFT